MKFESLICLTLAACLVSFTLQQRVLHIGVDGLLQRCLDKASHVAFDNLKAFGSSTLKARTAIQTMSGPGWSNILCGMDSEMTGITNNSWEAPWILGINPDITPVTGNETPIPCIFEHLKKNGKKTGAIYDWEWFINLTNYSIKGSLDYDYFCPGNTVEAYEKCDDVALDKFKYVVDNGFDYLFVYLGQVDEAGHEFNFCSDSYINRLTKVDSIISQMFFYLKEKKIFDSTHILFNTDHGASYMTKSHGHQDDDNLLVPWIISGPSILSNYTINSQVKNLDGPATISKIFGISPNPIWKSRSVDEVFNTKNEKEFLS